MLAALATAGCPVDLARHISCEMCQPGSHVEHAGGYDDKHKQVGRQLSTDVLTAVAAVAAVAAVLLWQLL